MSKDNSPFYDAGLGDGTADAETESACPPGIAAGPDPERTWSWMYKRGYADGYQVDPCACDGSCRARAEAISA